MSKMIVKLSIEVQKGLGVQGACPQRAGDQVPESWPSTASAVTKAQVISLYVSKCMIMFAAYKFYLAIPTPLRFPDGHFTTPSPQCPQCC